MKEFVFICNDDDGRHIEVSFKGDTKEVIVENLMRFLSATLSPVSPNKQLLKEIEDETSSD